MNRKTSSLLVSTTLLLILLGAINYATVFLNFSIHEAHADPEWWDRDWGYRMKLTFDNSASAENLVNFPVMVNLSQADSDFWSHVDSNHEDLRFIDDDSTTELYFEVEYWSYGNLKACVWVEVPQIDAGLTTDFICVYYGNSGATESSHHDPREVWDSNFMMVQHLEETSGPVTDSARARVSGNNGTYTGDGQDALGKIDGADNFDGNDYTTIADDPTLNFGTISFSYSFWFMSRATTTQYLLDKKGGTLGNNYAGYKMGISSDSNLRFSAALGNGTFNIRVNTGSGSPGYGTSMWTMFTVVVNRAQGKMLVYINGQKNANEGTIPSTFGSVSNTQRDLILGRQSDSSANFFNGMLDEVCISKAARSADWIEASYLSTKGDFTIYGAEEESGRLMLTVTSPQNTAYYTPAVPLSGNTNLDADISYSLDGQDNVTVASSTQSFSTSLSGLSYSSHTVTVYAVDSADASNTASAKIDFAVEKPAGWNCKYRKNLTFRNSASSGDLIDFPILVVLNPSIIDYTKTSATDIRFYYGNTLLPKETELWNEAGNSYIWVKVPHIDNTDTDYIYAYYNCSGAANEDDAASVWNSYVMVQHLEETSGPVTDSTSYDNDGTAYNGVIRDAAGKIDGADHFDGVNDCIGMPHYDSLNLGTGDFTISVWVKYNLTATNADSDILRKGNTGDTIPKNYKLELVNGAISGVVYESSGASATVTTPDLYSDNKWHFAVFRRESTTIYLYVDGNLKASTGSAGQNVTNTSTFSIGSKNSLNDDFFDGTIDEVRIAKTARNADWIKASYLTMNDDFIAYGSEEPAFASIESCTDTGTKKDTFTPSEIIYVNGTSFSANTDYDLYIVSDVIAWTDGMEIPSDVRGAATTVHSNSTGHIPPIMAWSSPVRGKYDIVVDVDSNGKYDQGVDALDDSDIEVYAGFFVIPEYAIGTILALAMCFGGVIVYRKYRHNKP